MKILNFPDDTTPFLSRDINCHTRIQSIKKSHEIVSSSKTNFSKIQPLWAGAYENRIDNQEKRYGHICKLKYLKYVLLIVLDNNNWGIINDK